VKLPAFRLLRHVFCLIADTYHYSSLSTPRLSCIFETFVVRLHGGKIRFSYDPKTEHICAREGSVQRFFGNTRRGYWLYANGLDKRGKFPFICFCLNIVNLEEGDVVKDCGAKYGDLALELFSRSQGVRHVGIEPKPQDYQSSSRILTGNAAYSSTSPLATTIKRFHFTFARAQAFQA
jgi:hypothetical protein